MITDTTATKPADWLENEPESIPDPEAEKPEEWDVGRQMSRAMDQIADGVGRGGWRLDRTPCPQPQV